MVRVNVYFIYSIMCIGLFPIYRHLKAAHSVLVLGLQADRVESKILVLMAVSN